MDSYTPVKFAMVHDQSGEKESHTLETFSDASLRGFRVVNPNIYANAVAAEREARRAAERAAVPSLPDYNAERNNADALLIAQLGYPDANGGSDAEGVKTPEGASLPVTAGARLVDSDAAAQDAVTTATGATPVAGATDGGGAEPYDAEAFRAGLMKGTHEQIDAFAERDGYTIPAEGTKAEKVDAIVTQRNEREGASA